MRITIIQMALFIINLAFFEQYLLSQPVQCETNDFVTKNIKTDFGAIGDGITNDQPAFEKAAKFFNQRVGCGKLIIPYGLYKVGRQVVDTPRTFMKGYDVLALNGASNLTIRGAPNNQGKYPVIKFADGLYYGSFYYNGPKFGLPKCMPIRDNYDRKAITSIGAAIAIEACNNISIENLELDGNLSNLIVGGTYGDVDRQLYHVGIYTVKGYDIRLKNIHTHHFALDGIENVGTNNLQLADIVSEYNGRMGLAWIGGDSLYAANCKFNRSANALIGSAPAAGVDIEPENNHDIHFGRFRTCEFAFNKGCGLVMAAGKWNVQNMVFEACTFIGYYTWSAWIPGINVHFKDCTFYGNITRAVSEKEVKNVSEITSFDGCYFSDVYQKRVCSPVSGYFFDLNSQKIRLNNCTIKTYNRGFMWHKSECGPIDSLTSEIENSNIYSANSKGFHEEVSGIKIMNSNLFFVEGKSGFGCSNDYYANLKKNSLTIRELVTLVPEFNNPAPYANNLKEFICKEERITLKSKKYLKRKPGRKKMR